MNESTLRGGTGACAPSKKRRAGAPRAATVAAREEDGPGRAPMGFAAASACWLRDRSERESRGSLFANHNPETQAVIAFVFNWLVAPCRTTAYTPPPRPRSRLNPATHHVRITATHHVRIT